MIQLFRAVTKKYALLITFVLLTNSIFTAYGETWQEKTKQSLTQTVQSFSQKIKNIAQSISLKIIENVQKKFIQFQSLGSEAIIPKLIGSIEKLGKNIGYISHCMLQGSCSMQERAAFISIAITIFALTAALIGVTISIATTSEEIQDHVMKVSEQARIWEPQTIFSRLAQNASEFKRNIINMQTCLVERKCTRTQKKILYATAGTIMALATIAVGVGIGAYIYARHTSQKEKNTIEQTEQNEGYILEEMNAYNDTMPTWKTKFMQQVGEIIKPISGAQQTLKNAYNQIQQQIKTGAIKTKEKAAELFNNLVIASKNIEQLIQETLNVSVTQAIEKFSLLKNEFIAFKDALQQSFTHQMITLGIQFKNLSEYGMSLANNIEAAETALHKLGTNKILLAKWYSTSKLTEQKAKLVSQQHLLMQQKQQLQKEMKKNREQIEPQFAQLIIKEQKLQKKIETIDHMIQIHRVVNKKFFDQVYPTLRRQLLSIDIRPVVEFINTVFISLLVKALNFAADIHTKAGNIGLIVTNDNIQYGLKNITYGVITLGRYAQQAIAIEPLITAPEKTTTQMLKSLLSTGTNIRTFIPVAVKEAQRAIQIAWSLKKPLQELDLATKQLSNALDNFQPRIIEMFKTTIAEAPLHNIPKAPIILLQALGSAIQDLKIAFYAVVKRSSIILNQVLDIGPGIFKLTDTFNTVFSKVTKTNIINPAFIQVVGEAISQTIPNIDSGIKQLIESIQTDTPRQGSSAD